MACRAWFVLIAAVLVPTLAAGRVVRTRLPRPRHGIQVRLTPFTVPARGEREVCQAIELANDTPIDVTTLKFATPGGAGYVSHHFALFVDDNDDLPSLPKGPATSPGCIGFGTNFGSIITGVQAPRQAIHFPDGVGFTLEPHQILLLNLHYINATAKPLKVDGAIDLLRAPAGALVHHARAFQLGTADIDVPPDADGTATRTWIAPFPMNVVVLSTHSHKHTVAVDVDLVRGGNDAGLLIGTRDYEHPALQTYPTPLRLEAGDGLRWTCRYHNGTTVPLRFGITSDDEMCFAIGSFYTDDDTAHLPVVPGCFGGDVALTCPGL